jgi:hypothetical protein
MIHETPRDFKEVRAVWKAKILCFSIFGVFKLTL